MLFIRYNYTSQQPTSQAMAVKIFGGLAMSSTPINFTKEHQIHQITQTMTVLEAFSLLLALRGQETSPELGPDCQDALQSPHQPDPE